MRPPLPRVFKFVADDCGQHRRGMVLPESETMSTYVPAEDLNEFSHLVGALLVAHCALFGDQ